MIKPKNIIVAGSAGFILSFLISIISTHSLGHSLLRGLIFGVVFAGLDAGIELLSDKFLDSGESQTPLSEGNSKGQGSSVGNKVDITLSDDNLTDDGEGLKFAVGANRRTIDVPAAEPESNVIKDAGSNMENIPVASQGTPSRSNSQPSEDNGSFKPVQLGKTTVASESAGDSPIIKARQDNRVSAPEGSAAARRAQAKAEREADIKEVDELPDIGGFVPEVKIDTDDEGVIDDSEFAVEGSSDMSFSSSSSGGSSASEHDAETMTKAIRTLLHKED